MYLGVRYLYRMVCFKPNENHIVFSGGMAEKKSVLMCEVTMNRVDRYPGPERWLPLVENHHPLNQN